LSGCGLSRGAGVAVLASALSALTAACGSGGGGSDPVAIDLASVQGSPIDAARDSDPGSFAADFLRAAHFRSIVVEVDYPAGRPPCPEALELLGRRLQDHCDKPGGVTVVLDDAIATEAFVPVIGHDQLRSLEDSYRDAYASDKASEAVLYVVCVPGASDRDTTTEKVVGLSFGASSLALYLDGCDRGADPLATTAEMQATVLVHEMGHLLGLVNNGVPMVTPHEDPEEAHHDADESCVLHHHVKVSRQGPDLDDDEFAAFCPHCAEDMRAFGGR